MRQLAIRQPLPLPSLEWANILEGASNLGQLPELQSLDLLCATITGRALFGFQRSQD
jgi:hypothetical protein